jgi:hypothetical protein
MGAESPHLQVSSHPSLPTAESPPETEHPNSRPPTITYKIHIEAVLPAGCDIETLDTVLPEFVIKVPKRRLVRGRLEPLVGAECTSDNRRCAERFDRVSPSSVKKEQEEEENPHVKTEQEEETGFNMDTEEETPQVKMEQDEETGVKMEQDEETAGVENTASETEGEAVGQRQADEAVGQRHNARYRYFTKRVNLRPRSCCYGNCLNLAPNGKDALVPTCTSHVNEKRWMQKYLSVKANHGKTKRGRMPSETEQIGMMWIRGRTGKRWKDVLKIWQKSVK